MRLSPSQCPWLRAVSGDPIIPRVKDIQIGMRFHHCIDPGPLDGAGHHLLIGEKKFLLARLAKGFLSADHH
jgi:hypothetical protein